MIEKSCACGRSKKNFKFDIGPFYVDECCLKNGYDEFGNKIQKDPDPSILPTQDEVDALANTLSPDLTPEPQDPEETSEVQQSPKEEREETPEERKARKKAEREAAKAKKKAEQDPLNTKE